MSDKPHVTSPLVYFVVFAALMVLTAVTVWVAFIDLGFMSDVVALTIALSKAILVVLFFMHVKHATALVKFVVVAGFLWLAILLGMTWMDYASRAFLG